jgi:hypothetical protein
MVVEDRSEVAAERVLKVVARDVHAVQVRRRDLHAGVPPLVLEQGALAKDVSFPEHRQLEVDLCHVIRGATSGQVGSSRVKSGRAPPARGRPLPRHQGGGTSGQVRSSQAEHRQLEVTSAIE